MNGLSLPYLEELYRAWQEDSGSVAPEWRDFFAALERSGDGLPGQAGLGEPAADRADRKVGSGKPSTDRADRKVLSGKPSADRGDGQVLSSEPATDRVPGKVVSAEMVYKQSRLDSLLWAYRDVGYFYARLNPLSSDAEPSHNYLYPRAKGAYEQLSLESFGLSEHDLDLVFSAGRAMNPSRAPLREILVAFQETYCSSVGVEYLHIQNKPIRHWLLAKIESTRSKVDLAVGKRRIILEDLIRAEEFEGFLHKTFIGQKRFSLEGSEVVIPALHFLVNSAAESGIEEVVLGMSHRGRLTVLGQILNKPLPEIFTEFEDNYHPGMYGGSGDVKYHLGYSTDHRHPDGSSVHITLVSNPSHLESVDPVVEGKTRGIQSKGRFISQTKKVVPIILHGDAAFSGQGVVAETFNLSQLRGYETGGTIHIIVNNQIGFTTSSKNARSTFFPTDVAKTVSVPIFHVNGDDPEAVIYVMNLALEFRQKFGYDAVVDIFCFRRHGHNEGDEPSFTSPKMYNIIRQHPGVATRYGRICAEQGIMEAQHQESFRQEYRQSLRRALKQARENPPEPKLKPYQGADWLGLKGGYSHKIVPTGVPEERLRRIARQLTTVPGGFNIHPKLKRIVRQKASRLEKEGTLDWSLAEALAFGSLLLDGVSVRLSGQDCERGTFSQRHATWWDTESGEAGHYTPLNNLSADQDLLYVYDSPLSEYSILGFEYGFSLSRPHMLIVWEAQFGDFCNGAQVIIDNFIVSAEQKWQRSSGLVMLLPHGFEGQGPEHSSAHLERFLQLCADDNIQVCNATTPAQYFHLLRRQMKRDFRKPLIVMSPKSLLRHPLAFSNLSDLTSGHFQEVLSDPEAPATAKSVVLCSGKLFYDLWERRRSLKQSKVALIRVEQLYPFPAKQLESVLARYPGADRFVWVQEEPRNRGSLSFIKAQFQRLLGNYALDFISRPGSASPATGSYKQHRAEQERVIEKALAIAEARGRTTVA